MRYADAPHVDMRPLLARRPELGVWYARAGWLATLLIVASTQCADICFVNTIAVAAGVLWFGAWYQAVGRLWRAPLVIALASYGVLRTYAVWAACTTCAVQGGAA